MLGDSWPPTAIKGALPIIQRRRFCFRDAEKHAQTGIDVGFPDGGFIFVSTPGNLRGVSMGAQRISGVRQINIPRAKLARRVYAPMGR